VSGVRSRGGEGDLAEWLTDGGDAETRTETGGERNPAGQRLGLQDVAALQSRDGGAAGRVGAAAVLCSGTGARARRGGGGLYGGARAALPPQAAAGVSGPRWTPHGPAAAEWVGSSLGLGPIGR
jgi:hypothetical protein